jgi:hypothetical protein
MPFSLPQEAFLPAYLPIVQKRLDTPFSEAQKHWQRLRFGRYAEFNLVYDRGTKFGLHTPGSRTESILMSLPRVVEWQYGFAPTPGSPEARLTEVLQRPRDWAAWADAHADVMARAYPSSSSVSPSPSSSSVSPSPSSSSSPA